jgi:hypothetical protein
VSVYNLLESCFHLIRVSHIAGYAIETAFVGGVDGVGRIATRNNYPTLARGQRIGQRTTDAPGSADDECDLIA